ncbi:DUF2933 domain-containing protein [Massilia sp. TWR1-2-2]|uniref:DUF2933 domain-containing protein n=1 Tax=Massilia sp. TWR1-2-2 TaxID=2804584 RepID=UPI003CF7216C
MNNAPQARSVESQKNRSKWVFLGFLAVAAFFLLSEHRAHFLGILPYLLILACPLMHFFHHGHRGHHAHQDTGQIAPETGVTSAAPANPGDKS